MVLRYERTRITLTSNENNSVISGNSKKVNNTRSNGKRKIVPEKNATGVKVGDDMQIKDALIEKHTLKVGVFSTRRN